MNLPAVAAPRVAGTGRLALPDATVEYRLMAPRVSPEAVGAPPPWIVFLHEGLGSISQWRDFPDDVCRASGCRGLVYARPGYGDSSPVPAPRPAGYLHREAQQVLPAVLGALRIERPLLVGHSDGASIALIHAGSGFAPCAGVVAMAPHVFVEDVALHGIRRAGDAYANGDLRARLARHHADVDGAFRGWHDSWLLPDFRHWNIEEYLRRIECPVLAIQGEHDEYATMAQLDAIAAGVPRRVRELRLAHCGHSPQRDQREATLAAIVALAAEVSARRPGTADRAVGSGHVEGSPPAATGGRDAAP